MPVPSPAPRKLPKDFIWGYATGERRLAAFIMIGR
jgi:hypothetical protein